MVHALVQLAVGLVVLAAVLLAVVSWRLSQGPLQVPWLAERLQSAVNGDAGTQLSIGSASLSWEGFSRGVDRPLDIMLRDVTATAGDGRRLAAIPRAEVSLSVGWLLLGRIVPRAVEVDGARLRVLRAPDGSVTLDLGSLAEGADSDTKAPAPASVLHELSRPPAADHAPGRTSRWSQLRRVRIRDAAITVMDRQLGAIWKVPALTVDLDRQRAGGVQGHAEAALALGDQTAQLAVTAAVGDGGQRTTVTATLSPLVPAAVAVVLPQAAKLSALMAPVTLSASAELDADLQPVQFSVTAELGAGSVQAGNGAMPLVGATLIAEGTPDAIHLRVPRLELAPHPDAPRTQVHAQAEIARAASGALHAEGSLDLDAVAFADLPALWPQGVGGPGARAWVVQNVTDGTARNGHVELSADVPADLSDVQVTRLAGGLDGSDLSVHWLRPVPPIEHADAHVALAGVEAMEITLTAGRQAGGTAGANGQGGLRIRAGRIVIDGLSANDQFADIDADLAGPIADVFALLRVPRIGLLQKSALDLHDAAGQVAAKVTVTKLPLRDAITMDDVQIHANAQLTAAHIGGIVAGHDLDRGTLTIDASPDGLRMAGHAVLAGIPAQLQLDTDFRAGPPTQVVRSVAVSGDVDDRDLSALGVDVQGFLTGPAAAAATMTWRRNGHNEAAVKADMTRATLRVAPLAFVKPAGQPATLDAGIALDGDRLAGITRLHAEGSGFRIDGTADFAGGKPSVLRLAGVVFGSTTAAHGEVRPPEHDGAPWRVSLAGTSLDVSGLFAPKPPTSPTKQPVLASAPGPAYLVDARFDSVVLGPNRVLHDMAAHVENDGRLLRRASVGGRTGTAVGDGVFQVSLEPDAKGRRLTAHGSDAGGLLRALDVMATMQGGRLSVAARYDDTRADHPLDGTAQIDDFRIRNAPVLAKLLQAMTLYGVVDLVSGPGLGFTRLAAPFRYASDVLELHDARAFSASLGMTAKGEVDLRRQTIEMQGTIVPAYFFNSLLGEIPLIGRLFSPERGGGVFAATYGVHGRLDDPSIGVNPLAALTPGFLRGIFGIFDDAAAVRAR